MGFFDDIFDMGSNYEQRKVARFEDKNKNLIIDTAFVNDCQPPYETAIQHPDYRNGDWIIVEHYETKEQALDGHMKWVRIMTSEPLPETIQNDACDCFGALLKEWGEKNYKRGV